MRDRLKGMNFCFPLSTVRFSRVTAFTFGNLHFTSPHPWWRLLEENTTGGGGMCKKAIFFGNDQMTKFYQINGMGNWGGEGRRRGMTK